LPSASSSSWSCPLPLRPYTRSAGAAERLRVQTKPNQTTGAGEDFGENLLRATEIYIHPFYAIGNHDFPSMPLVCFVSPYLLLPLDTMQNHCYLLTERDNMQNH
jgi:hypothetical protein